MKGKTVFIYLGAFIVVVLVIVVMTRETQNGNLPAADSNLNNMPQDEVHQGLGEQMGEQPSSSNVMGDIKEKMTALQKDADDNPNDLQKQVEFANFLTSAHQMGRAIEYYERALNVEPKNKDVLLQLTYVYFMKNDMDKSEEICTKLLTFYPNNPEAKYNLGVIHEAKGDIEGARKMWKEVASMKSESDVVEYAKKALEKLDKENSAK